MSFAGEFPARATLPRVLPRAETVMILETMDALRKQWGLRYPME